MALPPPMTLAQVCNEVFTRCNLNTGGDRGRRALALVQSQVRRAQRELAVNASWLRLTASLYIDLVTGTTAYDFPDAMDPGRYMEVYVQNATTEKWFPLTPDPSQCQRNALSDATNSRPYYYWFNDQQFNISASPDTDYWDRIRLDGYLRETDLVNDEDLVVVDGEAVIQRAELFIRPRIGLVVTPDMTASHLAYVRNVRAQQSENESTMPGGDTTWKCRPQEGPGIPRSGYAYDASWQPDGWWG